MKVVLINTSDTVGGAAIAAKRLAESLSSHDINVTLLVQKQHSTKTYIKTTTHSKFKELLNFIRFAFERFVFYLKEKDKSVRFAFSLANTGEDISKNKHVQEADIIHLHWINSGFLSLKSLEKLFKLNKPIVWTFHDMWAFTGGCHYAGNCDNFKTECNNCPFLKNPYNKDLSNKIWHKKRKLFFNTKLNIVTCSNWLKTVTKESALLNDHNIFSIQNPVDTELFKPLDKFGSRKKLEIKTDKKLILFGAMNTNDKRKGSEFLIKALHHLTEQNPQLTEEIALVIFGKNKTPFETDIEIVDLKFIHNEADIAQVYNACDIFVTPSIEDNLPNTIVEAHSCGLPVVAFNATGMMEMVEHKKNGYLATYKSSEDLANGILWTLFESDYENLRSNSRKKALESYSQDISARKYIDLYKSLHKNEK